MGLPGLKVNSVDTKSLHGIKYETCRYIEHRTEESIWSYLSISHSTGTTRFNFEMCVLRCKHGAGQLPSMYFGALSSSKVRFLGQNLKMLV